VVTGIGGVGKTQLAVEFCYRYGRFFQGVHWIQANQEVAAGIAECGLKMGIQPWPINQPMQVEATLRAWDYSKPRLVVLDNLEDLEQLQIWLPRLGSVHIVATSLCENWPKDLGLVIHPLDNLLRADSLALLRKLAPRLEDTPDDDLDPIAERLDDFALAVDLAGRYLSDCSELTPIEYFCELNNSGSALKHESLKNWINYSPTRHVPSLIDTFSMDWNRLKESEQTARQIFLVCSYCAPNAPIPSELLALTLKAEDKWRREVYRALRRLYQIGMLTDNQAGPSIHPILAEFGRIQDEEIRTTKEESPLAQLSEALVLLTEKEFETCRTARVRPLRAHVQIVAEESETMGLPQAGSLWFSIGNVLKCIGDYRDARKAYERALCIDENVHGPDHPNVARDLNNLGGMLLTFREIEKAQDAFERALRIDKANFGENDPKVARDLNSLGSALQWLDDLDGAKAAYKQALAIVKKMGPSQQSQVASYIEDIGSVCQEKGNLIAAKAAYEQALKISKVVDGPDHSNYAQKLRSLGSVLDEQGDWEDALKAYNKALEIDEIVDGPYHPSVASDLNRLGDIYYNDMCELEKAKDCYERAFKIGEQTYGPDHDMVVRRAKNLGFVLWDLGDLTEAQTIFERVLQIDRDKLGSDHPIVADDGNTLGTLLQARGDYTSARSYYEQALAIFEATFGPDHPDTRTVRDNLASLPNP